MPFDNRPYINVNVYGQPVTALLDSGANLSCLGQSSLKMIKQFNLKVSKSKLQSLTTADGTKQKIEGFCQLPICVGSECRIIDILIVPSLQCKLILGSDFCKLFSLIVDFSNNSWNISSNLNNLFINILTEDKNDDEEIGLVDLSTEQKVESERIISLFRELSPEDRLGRTNKIKAVIDTGDAPPFKKRQYPMSPFMLEYLHKELDRMLALGVVEPSCSP